MSPTGNESFRTNQPSKGRVGRRAPSTAEVAQAQEVKEIRSRLAAILESSEDTIVGKTLDSVITSWNPTAPRLYGFTAEEAVGRNISIIVPSEREVERTQILSAISAGGYVEHLDSVRVRKDGTRVEVFLSVSPILDLEGRIARNSAIKHRIIERKRTEERARFQISRLLAAGPSFCLCPLPMAGSCPLMLQSSEPMVTACRGFYEVLLETFDSIRKSPSTWGSC